MLYKYGRRTRDFFFFLGGGGGAFCFHFVLLFPYFWSVLNETIFMNLCYYKMITEIHLSFQNLRAFVQ